MKTLQSDRRDVSSGSPAGQAVLEKRLTFRRIEFSLVPEGFKPLLPNVLVHGGTMARKPRQYSSGKGSVVILCVASVMSVRLP